MSNKCKFKDIKYLYSFIVGEVDNFKINEITMNNWVFQLIREINTRDFYSTILTVIEVDNYQAELPQNFNGVIQMMRDQHFYNELTELVNYGENTNLALNNLNLYYSNTPVGYILNNQIIGDAFIKLKNPNISVSVGDILLIGDQNYTYKVSNIEIQQDNTYIYNFQTALLSNVSIGDKVIKRPNDTGLSTYDYEQRIGEFFFKYGYIPFISTSMNNATINKDPLYNRFVPIRLSLDTMFNLYNIFVESEYDKENISTNYQYDIVNNEIVKFNFKKGKVILSYIGLQSNEDGVPLVPDDPLFFETAKYYILKIKSESDSYNNVAGARGKALDFKRLYTESRSRLILKLRSPNSLDEKQALFDTRYKAIPNYTPYLNHYSTLNNPNGLNSTNFFINPIFYNTYGSRTTR